jgi:hypothetical protein
MAFPSRSADPETAGREAGFARVERSDVDEQLQLLAGLWDAEIDGDSDWWQVSARPDMLDPGWEVWTHIDADNCEDGYPEFVAEWGPPAGCPDVVGYWRGFVSAACDVWAVRCREAGR